MVGTKDIKPLIDDIARLEHEHQLECQDCSLYRLCLPLGLHRDDLVQLDKIIKRSQGYDKGQTLFNLKDDFISLYVVRSGSFKNDNFRK